MAEETYEQEKNAASLFGRDGNVFKRPNGGVKFSRHRRAASKYGSGTDRQRSGRRQADDTLGSNDGEITEDSVTLQGLVEDAEHTVLPFGAIREIPMPNSPMARAAVRLAKKFGKRIVFSPKECPPPLRHMPQRAVMNRAYVGRTL